MALRIVDANANRAAEGLRTLEDFARFAAEDEVSVRLLKTLRHHLAQALEPIDRQQRLANRCAETDAGTEVTTDAETQRPQTADVVPAACERVTQALRQLEEFSKPLSAEVAEHCKQLRYRAYDDLAQVELRLCHSASFPESAQLYLLIDGNQPRPGASRAEFGAYVQALAEAGVDVFQLRDKDADGAKLVEIGQAIQAAIAAARLNRDDEGPWLVINDRVDIAQLLGADGVHVGQEDLCLQDVRQLVGKQMWIGVSTHDIQQAQEAEQGGADYIGCGPTFPSQTKQFEDFPGVEFSRTVAAECGVPAFAIGGINLHNVTPLLEAGMHRIAVTQAIHGAIENGMTDKAIEAARELKAKLVAAAKDRAE